MDVYIYIYIYRDTHPLRLGLHNEEFLLLICQEALKLCMNVFIKQIILTYTNH